jgi:hypothetical protein
MKKIGNATRTPRMSLIVFIVLGTLSMETLLSAPPDEDVPPMPLNDQGTPKAAATPPKGPSLFDTSTPNLELGSGTSDMIPALESSVQPASEENVEQKTPPPLPLPGLNSQWVTSGMEFPPLFGTEQTTEYSERSLLLTGKWHVTPHLSVSTVYDDNIYVQSQGAQADTIVTASPGITFLLGDNESEYYLVADYTLGAEFYASHSSLDTIDQNASVNFRWALAKTTLNFHAVVADDSGTSLDAGERVHRYYYDFLLAAHYVVSDKTSFDANTDFNFTDYQGLIGSDQIQAQGFFNYDFSPKTTFGIGATLGYMTVEGAAAQTFEQANARINYRATDKLSLAATFGIECRQLSQGGGESNTPVFGVQASWQPRAGTLVAIGASRETYASAILDDQNYVSTVLDATITQRLTDRARISLGAGYVNSGYSATASGVEASREDNYFYLRPAVRFHLYGWLDLSLFYEFSENFSSGQGGDSFRRNQVGIQSSTTF